MKEIIVALFSMVLLGCGSNPDRVLIQEEKAVGTETNLTMKFHSVLYYPDELGLNYPGIIVGIENGIVDKVSKPEDVQIRELTSIGRTKKQMTKEIVDKKIVYVSHIVEFKGTEGKPIDNCTHYDIYRQPKNSKPLPLIKPCENSENAFVVKGKNEDGVRSTYAQSWRALDSLKTLIDEKLADASNDYTHVFVVTMGWNTLQSEALQNFNSILKNLHAAKPKGERFNPLFIGVTWPSSWESSWVDPIFKGTSFGTKARDADELGFTWLGVLLHETLKDVPTNIKTVLIGHSFGSRSMSVAACIGPAIYRSGVAVNENKSKLDVLINLQGAYEYKRITENYVKNKPGEPHNSYYYYFPDHCNGIKFWATTSQYDEAVKTVHLWDNVYAGDSEAFAELCESGDSKRVNCYVADSDSKIVDMGTQGELKNINFINSDAVIFKNAFNTGGRAHSDIYRLEHGSLIWNMINH